MNGYIAKDDLIELLSDMQGRCGTRAELRQNSKIWQQVKDMPTADVVPVGRGHWIRTGRTNVYGGIELVCSECGAHVMVQHIEDELYCRHCGAYMFGVRKKE